MVRKKLDLYRIEKAEENQYGPSTVEEQGASSFSYLLEKHMAEPEALEQRLHELLRNMPDPAPEMNQEGEQEPPIPDAFCVTEELNMLNQERAALEERRKGVKN